MKVYPSRCEQREGFTTTRRKRNLSTACSIHILPDEILIRILSCLTLVEAVRTSILSHRWRHLWRFTSSDLVFKREERDAGSFSLLRGAQFVNLVNRIMDLHPGSSVDKLIIHFGSIGSLFPDAISRCIHFAMQKKVRVLELAALSYGFPFRGFLTIARAVELKSDFLSLTTLRLVNLSINDDMVEYLLSKCPRLEQLSLIGGRHLWSLNIVSSSLKSLTIWVCYNLRRLTISAANLVSLEYLGRRAPPSFEFMRFSAALLHAYRSWVRFPFLSSGIETEFCFENAPNLSEITSDLNYFRPLACKRHLHEPLKKLTLRYQYLDLRGGFFTSPTYRNLPHLRCLKELELEIGVLPDASLLFWVFFAMACPFLSTFSVQFHEGRHPGIAVVELHDRYRKRALKNLGSYRRHHKHLKLVKLVDVVDQMGFVEFAVNLLGIAKSLEKLIIKPRSDTHRMIMVEDLLRANLPLGAELVIQ